MRGPIAGLFATLAIVGSTLSASAATRPVLDKKLEPRAAAGSSIRTSTVIVTLVPGQSLPFNLQKYDRRGRLDVINGHVLDGVPDSELAGIAQSAGIAHVNTNDVVHATNFRTGITAGSFFVRENLGFTGRNVRIAVIDSGVALHDDLPNVTLSKSFLPGDTQTPHDGYGHGTHVSGIIAGRGVDSVLDTNLDRRGKLTGVAPDASILSLRVLDDQGNGTVDNVLGALQFVLDEVTAGRKIQVVNLSIGAPVTKSYWDDPLTLAAKKLVDRGVVVVAAAGNNGRDAAGHEIFGGITSPANAPWVITVGASSTQGTLTRVDDVLANFSSHGPTIKDHAAKPDIVAPGVGTVSTITPGTLYDKFGGTTPNGPYLVDGSGPYFSQNYKPYLGMTGTSMAAAVVSGTVALMLEANPQLTPNLIKAILEYTSESRTGYGPLEEGAGFLNSLGAVRLARYYATAHNRAIAPIEPLWSRHFFWGNHILHNGFMLPKANAWDLGVTWGSPKTLGDSGDNIVWGTSCGSSDCGDNIVWGTSESGDNIVWGTSGDGDNIVWGTTDSGDNIVWGTSGDGDNIVWGTSCGGSDCGDNIVWGTADSGDNIVWGTTDSGDNIVWGTEAGDNIVWGTSDAGDNIVWGTADAGDNIVWGTSDGGDNIVWGTNAAGNIVWGTVKHHRQLTSAPPPNESYQWFLDANDDAQWIQQEFGDTVTPRTRR